MPYFNSTAIRWADYDPSSRNLYVEFTSGPKRYTYYGVPPSIWQGLLNASSKGTYFDRYIRDNYSIAS
ncbi:MAG: KTSC domain-containing protein [Parvibaculaceae bacterium]